MRKTYCLGYMGKIHRKKIKKNGGTYFAALMGFIWLERNSHIFTSKTLSPLYTCHHINNFIHLWTEQDS